LKVLHGLGYASGEQTHDLLQNVRLIWCTHTDMPAVELVSPATTPGPLDNYLASSTELIYHLCYSAARINDSIDAIKADGIRVLIVAPPKPVVLFNDAMVGFFLLKGFGLIEILQDARRT